jgi:hypothetical protein
MATIRKRKRNPNVEIDSSVLPWFIGRLSDVSGVSSSWDSLGRTAFGVAPGVPFIADPDQASSWQFAKEYLREQILSKYDDGKPSPEKVETTWRRFHAAEELCARANMRLGHPPALSFTTEIGVWSVIETARRKIEWLLGPYDSQSVRARRSFTSGASVKKPKREGHPAHKYSGPPETTVSNLEDSLSEISNTRLWRDLAEDSGVWLEPIGNKLQCVPKNYKTDRTIAIEPSMNMYVQKGIGTVIRSRLKRVGIDLDSQDFNQKMALRGALFDDVATIDLSMASDTVSIEIVRQLLPPDWFLALEQCRSPVGVLPSGKKVVYRKFSSMGNGYTFELESLIFWALTWSTTYLYDGDMSAVLVYGDDITVDSSIANHLTDVLSFCGFTTNSDKTHIHGKFRESCGKHYHLGSDVTPFYIKRPVQTLSELFKLHNKLFRWVERVRPLMPVGAYESYRGLLAEIREWAPQSWCKPRIPDGYGDGAFVGFFDECLPGQPAHTRKRVYTGWDGWFVEVLAEQGREITFVDSIPVWADTGKPVKGLDGRRLVEGWLLYQLNRTIPSGWESILFPQEGGGLSLAPRHRVITILVPHYGPKTPL